MGGAACLGLQSHGNASLHFSGAQAASAHVDILGCAVHHRVDVLDVGLPHALRLDVGVADGVAVSRLLVANFTFIRHIFTLLNWSLFYSAKVILPLYERFGKGFLLIHLKPK
jgi:hypothetical protein